MPCQMEIIVTARIFSIERKLVIHVTYGRRKYTFPVEILFHPAIMRLKKIKHDPVLKFCVVQIYINFNLLVFQGASCLSFI